MFNKIVLILLTATFSSLLSTQALARSCDDGNSTFSGCDEKGNLCKNGRVTGRCKYCLPAGKWYPTNKCEAASASGLQDESIGDGLISSRGSFCPSYCIGTTRYEGRWTHGHGDPHCVYHETFNSPKCKSSLNDEGDNSSESSSRYRFESKDGFYSLVFKDSGTNLVTITIGQNTETVKYVVTGQEVTFIGSHFREMRISWIIGNDGLTVISGDHRIILRRID